MVTKPVPNTARWEGLIACLWFLLVDALLLNWALRRPVDAVKFVLFFILIATIPFLVYLLYRTWAAFSLEYWADRNAVTIRWATGKQVIPINAITRILRGINDLEEPGWRYWPTPYVRPGRALGLLNVNLFATRPLAECLLLETEGGTYALSPREPDAFLADLQNRYRMGPARTFPLRQESPPDGRRLLGEGNVGPILLGLGLLGIFIVVGLLMAQFPFLPDGLTADYDGDGIPDLVREKSSLFLLPAMGILAWLINGLWGLWLVRREQATGAYMLWGGAVVVQICSIMALVSFIR